MTLATTAGAQLAVDLKPQLKALVEDMRTRLDEDPERTAEWRATHQRAVREERTAGSWTDYVEDQVTQAAVGWLLTSVFVRFCEDNLLLGDTAVWISGPTEMLRQRARDAEDLFYREDSDRSYREWLEQPFAALRANPGTRSLLDDHAAIEIMEPSSYAVEQLLAYWRRTDDDGALVWRFDDPDLSTRFLGDLYQDLSDYAKKKYALLQTPEFVEEFILDQTMEPALKDRPLEGFKIIDPTCGSGHFLLGAFERLAQRWEEEAPGMDSRARVNKALASVHGVDINPFAVAIAKFRLIVAAMKAAGDKNLVNVPRFEMNLAAGDSLLFGPESGGADAFDYGDAQFDADAVASGFAHSTEDRVKLTRLLTECQYDAVVGNPPYITVKDKALNARYRDRYRPFCKGKYALTVPFMVRFFALAKIGDRPGWVGQITSNSFMKREFGVPIIEEFLAKKDLRIVVDTSGAYIPGHGTPTVVIVGRNAEFDAPVRAVLGIQGEPGVPDEPARGRVWMSIVENLGNLGYEDQWISVADLRRDAISTHPWSLSGGGAVELSQKLDEVATERLGDLGVDVGMTYLTAEDDAYLLPPRSPIGRAVNDCAVPVVLGTEVRDYRIDSEFLGILPVTWRGEEFRIPAALSRHFWTYRTKLSRRLYFGQTPVERGLRWFDVAMFFTNRHITPLSITFAEVATHNHFVLDRGGKVFKQTAPVIKLPEDAAESQHIAVLGVLNSSSVCFWLKQNCYPKGGDPIGRDGARVSAQPWSDRFQFNGTTVADIPLPSFRSTDRASRLDQLAQKAIAAESGLVGGQRDVRSAIHEMATVVARLSSAMISEQENLDWEVYHQYGLIDEDLNLANYAETPGLSLGERAFEIALARRMAAGEVETEWFSRHGSTPITENPSHWPDDYRALVQRRLDAIENNPYIRLLERPEYKRRWAGESWDVKVQRALRDWLLDKLENPQLWVNQQGMPQPRSVGEISGVVGRDPEFIEALDLWAGHKDAPVTKTLEKLLSDQAVPYLAALRYKDSGLRKRAEWESVWELQRAEDRGEVKATEIPVPPKYTTADFRKTSYWSHRGKLDVPKERFILYPDAGRDTDPTPLLGWAGWNHAEQSLALAAIIAERQAEGAETAKLVPVVAGIAELLPWVKQWHSGTDPNLGVDFDVYFDEQLQEWSRSVGVPVSELNLWRPAAATRGRNKKKAEA